jgi:hypothetical protein
MINRADRNLLMRVERILAVAAEAEKIANYGVGGWAFTSSKAVYDRLLREHRDLVALRRRLEEEHPAMLQVGDPA